MKTVFVIHNSEGTFLSKQGQWVSPVEASTVWRSPHHDVALNHMIEANAREIMLRLQIMSCPLSERDVPLLDEAVVPKKMSAIQFDEPEGEAAAEPANEHDELDASEENLQVQADEEPASYDLFAEDLIALDQSAAASTAAINEPVPAITAPPSDAADVRAKEFAQTTAADPVVIAGELETTDYSNSTER